MKSDRAIYKAGQSARLMVELPFAKATALLAVEREGMMETRVVALHGPRGEVVLPVQASWSPNVFVTLMAITPAAQAGIVAMPKLATGALKLKVSNAHRALRVKISSDKSVYAPRQQAKVRIHVTMPDGTPAPPGSTVTFAAVDESLLALQDNPSWQLLANLTYPRFYNGASYSPLTLPAPPTLADQEQRGLERLVKALNAGEDLKKKQPVFDAAAVPVSERMMSVEVTGSRIDPAAGIGPELAPARKDLPPALRTMLDNLLLWKPALALDKNGVAELDLPLNDALTRFRLVAVASVGSNFFGDSSININVSQDVQLSSGLPPVAREGDRLDAMVTVRNAGKRPVTLALSARADGIAPLPPQTVRLAPGASKLVRWRVQIPVAITRLKWELGATEVGKQSNGDRLAVEQVIEAAIPVTVQAASLRQLDGELAIPLMLPQDALVGSGSVTIGLQSSLGNGLPGVRDWFERYPYRCLEQRSSRSFGMQDKAAWAQVMADLPKYLDQDGLASYFPLTAGGGTVGSDSLTAYLLAMSHQSGWEIPPEHRSRMLEGLSGFVESDIKRAHWSPRDDGTARKLAALAALAVHGKASVRMVGKPKVDADEWTAAMLIDWMTVLKHVKDIPDAEALREQAGDTLRARLSFTGTRMVFSTEKRDYWWWLMNNGDVDAARLLLAVRDLPSWRQDMPRIASGLMGRQEKGSWGSTVANVWGTLALEQFARQVESNGVSGQTAASLGAQRKSVEWMANRAAPMTLPMAPGPSELRLRQTGGGKPWVTVQALAAVPLTASQYSGYRIEKSMTAVQQKVAGRVSVGDVWRIKLSVDAQADMTWVVLNDAVPAGASVLGTGLGRDSASATSGEKSDGNASLAYEERNFTSYRAYYSYVPRGRFSQEYTIRINNAGTFELPPTRVEAMYAPEVFGAIPNAPVEITE